MTNIPTFGELLFFLAVLAFIPFLSSFIISYLRTAGMLIFLYGYGILVLEKFREGWREAKS